MFEHDTEDVADMMKDSAYTRKELVKCLLTMKTKYSTAKKSKEAMQKELEAVEAKV